MFTFLLVVQAIIAALLVTVILMQRSEGGGLTSSGSPSGLMSARGAADFLTRSTAVLATVFVLLSIALAVIAATRGRTTVDVDSAVRTNRSVTAPAQTGAPGEDALSGAAAAAAAAQAQGNAAAPAGNSGVPLQQ